MEIIVPSSKIYDYNTSSNISDNSVKSVSIDQKKMSLINEQQKNISQTLKINEDYSKGEYPVTSLPTTVKEPYEVVLEGTPPQDLSGEMWCGYKTLIPEVVEKTITQQRFVDNYYITSISPVIKLNFKVASSPITTYFDCSSDASDYNRFRFYAHSIVENTYVENYHLTGTENLQSIQDSYYSNSNYYTSKNGSSANMAVKFENFEISLAYFLTRDDINDEPSAKEIARIDISKSVFSYMDLSQQFNISYTETDENYSITAKFVPNFKVLQSILDEKLSYKNVYMVVNGAVTEFELESVEIQLNEQIIKLEEETETVKIGENASAYSYTEENEFLQESNTFNSSNSKNKNAEDIISNWQNGKETLSIRCSIGDYYDANENKVISPEYHEKMLFDIYDEVLPCYNTPYGDAPLSILDGKPKKFLVLGSKINFDGAVWQELTLQESGISNAVIQDGSVGLAYREIDGELYCVGMGTCTDTDITIASAINGTPVRGIRSQAFSYTQITSVNIGKFVNYIGDNAFSYCNISSVEIPDNVNVIDSLAFYSCPNLSSVIINNSSINNMAFASCPNLKSVVVKNGNIGTSAFSNCQNLETALIENGEIGNGEKTSVFSSCTKLKTVTIGSGVSSIGRSAFNGCTSLDEVIFKRHSQLQTIFGSAFTRCSSLVSFTVPDSVTTIGSQAFNQCSSLTHFEIGDSVTEIGSQAFYGCSNLTSIIIGSRVSLIGNNAFWYCEKLSSVYIYNIAKWCEVLFEGNSLASNPLYYAKNIYLLSRNGNSSIITDLVIPFGTTYITNRLFGEANITSVYIPQSVTVIGERAFFSCPNLAKVSIYGGVIESLAFFSCTNLKSATLGDGVTTIGNDAFNNCGLTSVVISNSVTDIGDSAFRYCSKLKDVYYEGTEEEWNSISIGAYNADLLNATIHFNSQ